MTLGRRTKLEGPSSRAVICASPAPRGDLRVCFLPPGVPSVQPRLPLLACVHVRVCFLQVGLDQQTVKLVCTNRRKQFLLDTADVALAE